MPLEPLIQSFQALAAEIDQTHGLAVDCWSAAIELDRLTDDAGAARRRLKNAENMLACAGAMVRQIARDAIAGELNKAIAGRESQ